jgi:hypothetical protein
MCLMYVVNGELFDFVDYVHKYLCALVKLVNCVLVDVLLYLYTWRFLIDDVHFGDNNDVWFIWMWFDDFFGDDDFLAYTFEMMNCIVELIMLNEE